jgi:hypothetical protein
MKEMFNVKDVKYNLRDSNIVYLPKFNKITYGKNLFSIMVPIYGTHCQKTKSSTCIDMFKTLIKAWEYAHSVNALCVTF